MASENSNLAFLADLMEMDKFSTKTIGFCTIMKVDNNTFTISSIDKEEFANSLPKEFVNEFTIKNDDQGP